MLRVRVRSSFMPNVGIADVVQSLWTPSHDELSAWSEGHSVMHSALLSSLVAHPQLLSISVLHSGELTSGESLEILSSPLQSSITESQLVSQDLLDVSTLSLLDPQPSKQGFAQLSPVLHFTMLILEIFVYIQLRMFKILESL